MSETDLTVAVTGPTGTFGFGLMPLLQSDDRVSRVVGIARRPFDAAAHGWSKMEYRRGDVRDPDALTSAFSDVDVVVHLAFLIVGGRRETTRAINIDGTVNAFRAAAAAGARRFVYASSVAAYGFHRDNPVGMREDWPTRPADRLYYAQEKAELEEFLRGEATRHPDVALYMLRPCIVLGPHTVGEKDLLPGPLAGFGRRLSRRLGRLPIPIPAPIPDVPMQFVHEDDVGSALLQCVVAAGPPGAYNIAGAGVLSALDVARELGFIPIPVPARPTYATARALARLPFLPATAEWVEALSHPAIMDTTLARTQLGWTPRFSGLEALRDTLRRHPSPST
ncbi:MAG TPA: NAD-dependent epimerase/dehydratase family protein [Ilumatobacteraceae bacterium]|nr:NAD-dependent epimerase/dehydratase family protein [Ilumatobacteraceae bacterium]